MSDDGKLLGVVILTRHGDREGYYQDPKTYTSKDTAITPLGSQQEYQLGQYLRSRYLNSSSSSFISGVNASVADDDQIKIRADGGGEGGVIFNSALSMLQGLFPPTRQYNTTLANGTMVVGPLSGYQTVPIESVDSEENISLEGWVDCNTFTNNTKALYASSAFAQKEEEAASFLSDVSPYVGGRPTSLENMWNIFDYLNVQSIHNATFAAALPDGYLVRARDFANWLQFNVFSSPEIDGVGNIPGRTMVSSILDGVASIVDSSDPLKIRYEGISYKPFISLFQMIGAVEANLQLAGIVNYAAAIAFEVRSPTDGGEPTIRLQFKNGSEEATFTEYEFMGTRDVPMSAFVQTLAPVGVNDTTAWCHVCSNTETRGCQYLVAAQAAGVNSVKLPKIGSIGAGFLGAGLALLLALGVFGVLVFIGVLTVRPKRKPAAKGSVHGSDTESQPEKY
ncbi:phosphoglycerate mutase-like protein [Coprinellus micaceus]|uniref:Phosphoglycerate mutase-like protein n=1 Tax=Coprinellus micaceus TaxID=71717 RepID=A0A4Y7SLJ3_COPMI|nr:phosphoglycerate mutase-like protein [Coprinellus micaceus]